MIKSEKEVVSFLKNIGIQESSKHFIFVWGENIRDHRFGQPDFFMVDWGDNSEEKWNGPYGTDELIRISHTWATKGNYDIRVIARNKWDQESPWRDPKPSAVSRSKDYTHTPIINFLQNFFKSHPNLFPFLQKLIQQLVFGM